MQVLNIFQYGRIIATGYVGISKSSHSALYQSDEAVLSVIGGEPSIVMAQTRKLNSIFSYWKTRSVESDIAQLLIDLREKKVGFDETQTHDFDSYVRLDFKYWAKDLSLEQAKEASLWRQSIILHKIRR